MSNADKQIKDILAKYEEDFASNTWVVPGGKARAIYHKTIERMSAKAGVVFDRLEIVRDEPENVVIVVWGSLDKRQEWSFGEASPKNNKNAYPYSMAEKRGKDRVALKLIGLHGLVYSEEEAEDFKAPAQQADPANDTAEDESKAVYVAACKKIITSSGKTYPELVQWWKDEGQNRRDFGLTQGEVDDLKQLLVLKAPQQKEAAE